MCPSTRLDFVPGFMFMFFYITFPVFFITADLLLNRHCAFSQRFKNTLLFHQNFFSCFDVFHLPITLLLVLRTQCPWRNLVSLHIPLSYSIICANSRDGQSTVQRCSDSFGPCQLSALCISCIFNCTYFSLSPA